MVLGAIFLVLGLVIGLWGVYELSQGVSRDKYGNRVEGSMGKLLAIVRIVAGVGCCGFALYKMAFG